MVARNHIAIDGSLGTSRVEQWSVGITYATQDGSTVQDAVGIQNWAAAAADLLEALTAPGLLNLLSASGSIDQVRTYHYPASGPADLTGLAQLNPRKIGTGTISKPPQCAAVFSLYTPIAGRRYRGRIYWPWMSTSTDAATLKGAMPVTAAAEMAALLTALGEAAPGGDPLEPMVYSAAGNFLTPVNQVRVGDVVDTQRRRRDNLIETYQASPV